MSSKMRHARISQLHIKRIWLPMLVGGLLCALVLVLWWMLYQHEHNTHRNHLKAEAENLAKHMETDLLRKRIPNLQHLAQIWEIHAGLTQQEFKDIASTDAYNFPGMLALARLDKDHNPRWTVPEGAEKYVLNIPALTDRQKRAAGARPSILWKAGLAALPDYKHFLLCYPLYSNTTADGCLLQVFHIQTWLDYVFRISRLKHTQDDFRIAVFMDNIPVYRQPGWDTLPDIQFEALASIEILDNKFSLSIRPTPAYLEKNQNLPLAFSAVMGLLLSLLVAFTVYLIQKSHAETSHAKSAQAALEIESVEHKKTADMLQLTLGRIEMAAKAGGIGVWAWNIAANTLNWNERMFQLYDLPSDINPVYETWRQAVHPEDLQATEELLQKAVAGKAAFNTEFRIITSSGGVRYLGAAARAERDAQGKPLRVTGINWDMTGLKEAELSLRHNAEMQKLLTGIASRYINIPLSEVEHAIPQALQGIAGFIQADRAYIYQCDFEQGIAARTYEWRRNDVEPLSADFKAIEIGRISAWVESHRKNLPVIVPDVSALPPGNLKTFLETQHIKSIIAVPIMHGNELRGYISLDSVTGARHYTEEDTGLLLTFSQIIVSIDLRSRADMERRKSAEQVRLLLDSTAEAIYGIDLKGGCTFANPACLRLLGYTDMNDLLGLNMHNLIHHSHADGRPMPMDTCKIYKAFQQGEGTHVDDEVLWRADGSFFPVEYWSYPQVQDGNTIGAVVAFVDITARKRMEDELRESEANFRAFFETMTDMVFVAGNDAQIIFTNTAVERKLGYSRQKLTRMNLLDLHPPENRQEAMEICAAIFRGERQNCPLPLVARKGDIIPVDTRAWISRWNGAECVFAISKDLSAEQEAQQRLERLFRNNPAPMVLATFPDTRIYDANDAFEKVIGYARHQITGKTAAEIGLFPEPHKMAEAISRLRTDNRLVDFELQIRRKDGGILHGLFSGELVKSQTNRYIIMVMIDITGRKKAEEALAIERRRLADILEGTNVGTWEWNVQTGEVIFNERWAQMTGYSLAELEPMNIGTWVKLAHPDDLKTSNALLEKHFSGQTPYYECEARMRHKEGHWIWVLDRGKVASWSEDGKPLLMSGTHQDITARKLTEEHIHHLATHDMLTGLPSLRLAQDRLAMAKNQARRQKNIAAVMFIDLDGFKTVNDTLGHEAGDYVLSEVAGRLLTCVRETDTVARIGGDEFLVIATGLNSPDNAGLIAQKILEQLSRPVTYKTAQPRIGASIGIALYPKDGEDMDVLIKQADQSMYRIKQSGKNAYAFVTPPQTDPSA